MLSQQHDGTWWVASTHVCRLSMTPASRQALYMAGTVSQLLHASSCRTSKHERVLLATATNSAKDCCRTCRAALLRAPQKWLEKITRFRTHLTHEALQLLAGEAPTPLAFCAKLHPVRSGHHLLDSRHLRRPHTLLAQQAAPDAQAQGIAGLSAQTQQDPPWPCARGTCAAVVASCKHTYHAWLQPLAQPAMACWLC